LPLTALLRRRCPINACRERCHNFRPDAHQGEADFAGLGRQIAYAQATKIRIAALVCRDVCDCDGDFHMRAMSVLALAALSVAGMAEAQTGTEQMTNQPSQAQSPVRTAPDGSFKDECGFRYNTRGDRIDARGRVLPPPVTPPNGRSCK